MNDITRFPLAWPARWKRSSIGGTRHARFTHHRGKISVYDAVSRLENELVRLGATDPILSTNLKVGLRGDPLSGQAEPKDRAAAVYFKLNGADRVLACDCYTSVSGNIAAIAAHIDALRRIDRYGVGTIEQAFAGYDALPAPSPENRPQWRAILGFRDMATVTADDIKVNFRALAKASIGNDERLIVLNMARDEALRELGA